MKWRRERKSGIIEVWARLSAFDKMFEDLFHAKEIHKYYVKDSRDFGFKSVREMQEALDNMKMLAALSGVELTWKDNLGSGANGIGGVKGYELKFVKGAMHDDVIALDNIELNKLERIKMFDSSVVTSAKRVRGNPILKFMEVM